MAGRKQRRGPAKPPELEDNLIVELIEQVESLVPTRDRARLEQNRVITWDTLDEWRIKNGTPRVEVDQKTWDRVQRYKQIIAYSMDLVAPMLPLAVAQLAQMALEGNEFALKLFLSYFLEPLAQRSTIDINQQSVSIEVKEERWKELAAQWQRELAQSVVLDPIVDSIVVPELMSPQE